MTNSCLNNESLGDFTVYGSSGASRKVRVENTNNTGSSNAVSEIFVEGTSSGDAYARHIVSTSHSFALGIDNSDSDKFKLTYSSDQNASPSSPSIILNSNISGIWRRPMTPLFESYVSSTYTMGGSGTPEAVHCDSEVFDQGSNYNTGTYTFTCPVTGTYLFTLSLQFDGVNSTNDWGDILIYHSGVGGYVSRDAFSPANIDEFGNFVTLNISVIIYASSGDTVLPYVSAEETENIHQDLTRFTGYLLG